MEVPTYSPREIVSELDRFIVGQDDAKRAVAIALRNRWRRQQLPEGMREEVVPKNILMIGPTGCGKTEIARRLAKLAQAPFLKVEATKFTEVGYVGRDVESIVRDLVEVSMNMLRDASRKEVQAKAEAAAEERLITALVGEAAAADTRSKFRRMLRDGELEDKEIEVALTEAAGTPIGQIDIPGMPPGQMINLGEMMKGMFGNRPQQKRKMTVAAARRGAGARGGGQAAGQRPADQGRGRARREQRHRVPRRDRQDLRAHQRRRFSRRRRIARGRAARPAAADRGHHGHHQIRPGEDRPHAVHRLRRVPSGQAGRSAAGVAGAAADPRGTGAAVARRSAPHPDRAGAFAAEAVRGADGTEKVTLMFADDAVDALAELAADINDRVENIGARRLHTVLEKLLEEISFTATDRAGETMTVDAAYVNEKVAPLAAKGDLSRFIL